MTNAPEALAGMIAQRRDALRDAAQAGEARRAAEAIAREHGDRATRRAMDATQHRYEVHDLLRALANADETEPAPITEASDRYGGRWEGRATFGRVWLSCHTPHGKTSPRWHASGDETNHGSDRKAVSLWETDRGTNDPAKLAAQLAAAKDAAYSWLAARTASEWLRARDIEPSDPAALLRVVMDPDISSDAGRVHLSARWQVEAIVPGLEPLPLLDRPASTWTAQDEPRTDPWRDEPGAWWSCTVAEWRNRPEWGQRMAAATDPDAWDPRAYYPAEVVAFHDRHALDVLAWYLRSLRRDRP